MTKSELLEKLSACAEASDSERAHADADRLLIEYIADEEIAEAYDAIERWYA